MSRPCAVRITLYLEDSRKGQEHSDQMWNRLIALDAMIVEEHTKAGVIIVEVALAQKATAESEMAKLEKVPGVAAIKLNEPTPEEERKAA